NGNVLIFDNGMHRVGMPRSAVVEVSPRDNSVAWRYTANPDVQFLSAHISGAERLPNGNVLVCEGASGRVFEITRAGEVVWEWTSPFPTQLPNGDRRSWLFRAHRYGFDYAGLAGQSLEPGRYDGINRAYGLSS